MYGLGDDDHTSRVELFIPTRPSVPTQGSTVKKGRGMRKKKFCLTIIYFESFF